VGNTHDDGTESPVAKIATTARIAIIEKTKAHHVGVRRIDREQEELKHRHTKKGERLRLAFVPGLISAAASFHFPARRPQGHHEETPFGIRMPGHRFVAEKSC